MPVSRARALSATLGAAAVVLMTVAPAAVAQGGASAVTDPQAVPAPWVSVTGTHTDACDTTTTPGWITTAEPTLTAHTDAPAARFKVFDSAGRKVFDDRADTVDGTVRVRPAGLTDAAGYSWQVWPEYNPGSGKPTDACHFGVDTAAPTGLSAESTDFPRSDSGITPTKYAGQYGTFTFKAADQGSGVACYQFTLSSTLSTGTCTVPAGPDGTVTVRVRPLDWGTNTLTVQAFDNAGNATQPVTYDFYAPSNPNPPSVPGDADGDGVPDILLPDAAGNLQIISADAASTTPNLTVSRTAAPVRVGGTAPDPTGWTDVQTAHRGWDNHAPMDDLFTHRAGEPNVHLFRNTLYGQFLPQNDTLLARPSSCGTAGCPEGYAADWSKADQLVSLGSLNTGTRPSLATVENGNLLLFTDPGFGNRFRTVKQLSTGGAWAGYDLVAPGKAADGSLALWARERATGTLRAYPLPQAADGTYDFSALADPAAGAVVGSFPVAGYPVLGSSGDGDGDGLPDLYAVTADRHLLTFHSTSAPKDLGLLR